MKSKIVEAKEVVAEIVYPCLMRGHNGLVVLFHAKSKGQVMFLNEFDGWKSGEYHDAWNMDAFTPFHGTIELSN